MAPPAARTVLTSSRFSKRQLPSYPPICTNRVRRTDPASRSLGDRAGEGAVEQRPGSVPARVPGQRVEVVLRAHQVGGRRAARPCARGPRGRSGRRRRRRRPLAGGDGASRSARRSPCRSRTTEIDPGGRGVERAPTGAWCRVEDRRRTTRRPRSPRSIEPGEPAKVGGQLRATGSSDSNPTQRQDVRDRPRRDRPPSQVSGGDAAGAASDRPSSMRLEQVLGRIVCRGPQRPGPEEDRRAVSVRLLPGQRRRRGRGRRLLVHGVGLHVLVEERGRRRAEAQPPQAVPRSGRWARRTSSRRARGGRRARPASGGAARRATSG